MPRTLEVVKASQPYFTQNHCRLQARNPVEAETAEICQSQSVEGRQHLCLSVNIQNTSLEVALNKTTESYND